ncbi:uncharacterized protein METZ01_LOCUS16558 [marine metagenome]|uniref:Uncharacterized protein n=1 Tax=marine metagenome TaxID=408172 RepID=A0A381PAR7_9ZZZZ
MVDIDDHILPGILALLEPTAHI